MADNVAMRELARKVLELLDGARKSLAFYPADHPLVTEGFRNLEHALGNLFLGDDEVTLAIVDDEFYLNDLTLKRETRDFPKLLRFLADRDATSVTFRPEVTADRLRQAFAALGASPEDLERAGGARSVVEQATAGTVRLARAVTRTDGDKPREIPEEIRRKLADARQGYDQALASMKSVFDSVASDGHLDYRTIKSATEALLDSVVTNRNVWSHLLNVKHTDDYSFNHSVNVATLALLLGTRLGVRPDDLGVLGESALLHDLGKQKVPANILKKEGALTDEEWVEMRSHPEKGAKILLGIRDVTEASVMVAYEHHIRYDHKGYPRTRGRRELHLFSHIVAVADIYDALTSDRGYRKALLPDMAMRIILTQSGSAFHPLVVKHFLNLVGLFPVGTFVRLREGPIALVQYNQNRDLLRPLVLVVYDAQGQAIQPVTRDLSDDRSDPPIECSVDPAALGLNLG